MSLVPALARQASPELRAWLSRQASAVERIAADAVGCSAYGHDVVYDSEGRRYSVTYRVVAAALDGRSTVVVSHSPRDLTWTPGYPAEFQTRDLGSPEESAKINTIASRLEPTRLLGKHLDPTLGPPVVWPRGAHLFVLGGNGRTIAFLRAPEERYQAYLAEARCRWPDLFPRHAAPAGHRWLMVRAVEGDVDAGQAAQLAAASQRSTAAEEGRIGRALGLIRSLRLDVAALPPVRWTKPIAADNIVDFYRENTGFVEAIVGQMDPAQRTYYRGDREKLAQLVAAVFLGFLPAQLRRSGLFDNPRIEDALVGALPALVTTASLARAREIHPPFDLLPTLPEAIDVFQALQRLRLSFRRLRAALDEERRTTRIPGAPRLSDAPNLALALAAALYNAAGRTAPEVAVSEILSGYVEEARKHDPRQGGLFGAPAYPDPARTLAALVPSFALPDEPEPAGGNADGLDVLPEQRGGLFARANAAHHSNPAGPARRPNRGGVADALLRGVPFGVATVELPDLDWAEPVTGANVSRFVRAAPSFALKVYRAVGVREPAMAQAAALVNGALLYALSPAARAGVARLGGKAQAALVAVLPAAWSAHGLARRGYLAPDADPWAAVERLLAKPHGADALAEALAALLTTAPPARAAAVVRRFVELAIEHGPRQARLVGTAPSPAALFRRALEAR